MNAFEQISDFEKQPLSMIIWNLIKWYNVDHVTTEYSHRPNVESTVWIQLKIEKGNETWYVDGQRLDIVKRRLIEWHNRNNANPTPHA